MVGNEYIDLIRQMHEKMTQNKAKQQEIKQTYDTLATSIEDDSGKQLAFGIAELAQVTTFLYAHVEALYTAHLAAKEEVEVITEMIFEIPAVKSDPELVVKLERMVRDYDSKYQSLGLA